MNHVMSANHEVKRGKVSNRIRFCNVLKLGNCMHDKNDRGQKEKIQQGMGHVVGVMRVEKCKWRAGAFICIQTSL